MWDQCRIIHISTPTIHPWIAIHSEYDLFCYHQSTVSMIYSVILNPHLSFRTVYSTIHFPHYFNFFLLYFPKFNSFHILFPKILFQLYIQQFLFSFLNIPISLINIPLSQKSTFYKAYHQYSILNNIYISHPSKFLFP